MSIYSDQGHIAGGLSSINAASFYEPVTLLKQLNNGRLVIDKKKCNTRIPVAILQPDPVYTAEDKQEYAYDDANA
jgi:hypothetical protein